PIETPFGNFAGHSAEDVANAALELVDELRYVDVDLTFRTLCGLYLSPRADEERKCIIQSFEALARNDLNVWRRVGFGVQKALYDTIQALSADERAVLRAPIV